MSIFNEKIKPHLGDDSKTFGTLDPEVIISYAEEIGHKLTPRNDNEDRLKNHQLRKFYDTVKQIERRTLQQKPDETLDPDLVAQLLFLRPHLANAERKDRNIKDLRVALEPFLTTKEIQKKADLTRFVKFFEAIVAYTG
jgi:CRISPR type III-A-associated protein Csm2